MSYAVKEIFLTLQGEGAHAGRAAVFCRFAGCNLWSGRDVFGYPSGFAPEQQDVGLSVAIIKIGKGRLGREQDQPVALVVTPLLEF